MGTAAKTMSRLASAIILLVSSAAAAASATQAPAAGQAPNAWIVLTDLSASQAVDPDDPDNRHRRRAAVLPPPQVDGAGAMANGAAPVLVVGLWWVLIAIALAAGDNHNRANSPA